MALYTDLIAELQAEISKTQRQIDSVAGVNSTHLNCMIHLIHQTQ